MKKKFTLFFMCIMLICSHNLIVTAMGNTWNGTVATEFAGGNGTESNPYQIKTAEQLAYLAKSTNDGNTYKDNYFLLMNDIDLNNLEWTPIGNFNTSFKGVFNGQGYTINNLKITEDNFDNLAGTFGDYERIICIGLFGCTENIIKNLSVNGTINIKHNDAINNDYIIAGGIIGIARNKVINCHNSCNVSATSYGKYAYCNAGGIAGTYTWNTSLIDGCSNSGNIYAYAPLSARAGGVCGDNDGNGKIQNCWNLGEVTSKGIGDAGGITCHTYNSTLTNCYNKGNIYADRHSGGILAYQMGTGASSISNCYSIGKVISNGGIESYRITSSCSGGSIENCFVLHSDDVTNEIYSSETPTSVKAIGYFLNPNSTIDFEIDEIYMNSVTLLQALNSWVENNSENTYKKWEQQNGEYPVLSIGEEIQEEIYTTTKTENKLFVVTPTNVPNGSTIIFVCYNDKQMVYVESFTYAGEKTKTFTPDKEYDKVKVLVWENFKTCMPLCEAEDVPLN